MKYINKVKQGKKNRRDGAAFELKVRHINGKNGLKGKKRSEITKNKIRNSLTGRKHSFEIKDKISNTLKNKIKSGEIKLPWKGKKISEEKRIKLGLLNKGRKRTEEFKEKVSIGLKKAYAEGIRKGVWIHNTRPERELKEILNDLGINFEEQKNIYGTPDFFINPNICIFADGVYWHNYPNGSERDKEVNLILKEKGYKILRFWETEIYSNKEKIKEDIINVIGKTD